MYIKRSGSTCSQVVLVAAMKTFVNRSMFLCRFFLIHFFARPHTEKQYAYVLFSSSNVFAHTVTSSHHHTYSMYSEKLVKNVKLCYVSAYNTFPYFCFSCFNVYIYIFNLKGRVPHYKAQFRYSLSLASSL